MIIYTCPKCGYDLTEEVLTCIPPKRNYRCFSCGWCSSQEQNDKEEVIRIPWDENMNDRNVHTHEYTPIRDFMIRDYNVPEACRTCLNHPSNGGSGNCNCTLVLPTVTC